MNVNVPSVRDGPLEARGDEWTNLTPVRNAKDLNTIVGGRQVSPEIEVNLHCDPNIFISALNAL